MSERRAKSLPVVMYHYVNDQPDSIAVSRELFAEHCRTLAEHGWRGVGLAEAEAFLIHGDPLPPRSLLLTFDDGYLDNCVHALPVLHRYGHKAVMFAVSGRLETGTEPRVGLEDLLAGRAPEMPALNAPVSRNELGYLARRDVFCNQAEVRLMEASGVFSVAAHGRGHFGVFLGPEFTSFTRPGNQRRTFYLTETEYAAALDRAASNAPGASSSSGFRRSDFFQPDSFRPDFFQPGFFQPGFFQPVWGLPKFAVGPGLLRRAFLPSPELLGTVLELVPQNEAGADRFFADPANVERLTARVRGLKSLGRMESPEEQRERLLREIAGGKADLEAALGHPLRTLCWPWGAYSPAAHALAREAGFELFFTTREGSNPPGRPLAAHRFKGKAKSGGWLLSRARLYASPLLGRLYASLRMGKR